MTPTTKRELVAAVEAAITKAGADWACGNAINRLRELGVSDLAAHYGVMTTLYGQDRALLRALADVLDEAAK